MEFDAQFIIQMDCKFMLVFNVFCLVLSHVSVVLGKTKVPLDMLAGTAMAWIEPHAIVWRVEVRGVRERTDCDF